MGKECVYILGRADWPYSIISLASPFYDDTSRGAWFYKAKDSGANISFGGGVKINFHMAEYMCIELCACTQRCMV